MYFDCGAPQSVTNTQGCVFTTPTMGMWENLSLDVPKLQLPQFSNDPIMSADSQFIYGAAVTNCSVPCQTVCVPLMCGGNNLPCCCLELLNGKILSVGNGYVTSPPTVEIPGCLTATVYINDQLPPVLVQDCQEITVTLKTENNCCMCQQVDVKCAACATNTIRPTLKHKALWQRKLDTRTGKTKVNKKTGKPVITLNKNELLRRIASRTKNSGRRGK